jgi:hypothetical protein
MAPASAYATGLLEGAALADMIGGEEDETLVDEAMEIMAVEAGIVIVGTGATAVE